MITLPLLVVFAGAFGRPHLPLDNVGAPEPHVDAVLRWLGRP